jgi:nitrite reductase/ring-hydroxylating ferredoxin subunit
MSLDRSHIQCTQHGAMFQLNDGLCVYGPCVGESLTPVNIAVTGGQIILRD